MKKITACLVFFFYCNIVDAQMTALEAVSNDTTKVFTKTEIAPVFKSGGDDWTEYLRSNLNSGIGAANGAPVGTYQVIVSFIIRTDGSVKEVTTDTKFGFGMEQEAIRVVANSPAWTPARQNGYKVNFYYRQPFTFVVALDEINIIAPPVLKVDTENVVEIYSKKIPVELIEFEIINGNGTVIPAGKGKFIFKPSVKGAILAGMYIHTRNKKKKVTAAYFKAD